MGRLMTKEEKTLIIMNKIKSIQNLYDLAFDETKTNLINSKEFKLDLKLSDNEIDLKETSIVLKDQIKLLKNIYEFYPSHNEIKVLHDKLIKVYDNLIELLKDEFRNVIKRYSIRELNV